MLRTELLEGLRFNYQLPVKPPVVPKTDPSRLELLSMKPLFPRGRRPCYAVVQTGIMGKNTCSRKHKKIAKIIQVFLEFGLTTSSFCLLVLLVKGTAATSPTGVSITITLDFRKKCQECC